MRAFQRAIDKVRMLPLTPQRVAQKANLSFKDKFPYISVIDEASDFKFGTKLGFAKAHHKIAPRGISGRGSGLGELPKLMGFPFNIFATAEASNFKFCMPLRFARAHHKITHRGKVGVALCQGSSQIFYGVILIFLQGLNLAI